MRTGFRGLLPAALIAAFLPSPARATSINEFRLPAASDPLGITAGPDGNLWFTDGGATSAIGRITPAGAIKEFTQGFTTPGKPSDITLGPDGNLWFTTILSSANAIGKITSSGHITEFTTGLNPGAAPSNITAGPDGNLWFLDDGTTKAIGRVKPDGAIDEFPLADPVNSNLEDLTAGPDGDMWFTDRGNTKAIGRVTPSGTITEFTGMLNQINSQPNGITTGADGNLWFTDEGSPAALGSATADATSRLTEFTAGLQTSAVPDAITTGADGNVWFEDNYGGQRAIGRITPAGAIKEFTQGLGAGVQDDITVGPDGNVWVEQSTPGGIARITPAGVITQFTNGLLPGAGSDGDQLVTGPDGNLWFSDRGAKAIGRVALQLPPTASTGAASQVSFATGIVAASVTPLGAATKVQFQYGRSRALGSTAAAGTLSAGADAVKIQAELANLPPASVIYYRVVASDKSGTTRGQIRQFKTTAGHITSAKVGNQRITLITPPPRACTSKTLIAFLNSTRVSRGTKLHFVRAAFYLGSVSRASTHQLPVTIAVPLTGQRSGSHQLKVILTFTSHMTKTVNAGFRIC